MDTFAIGRYLVEYKLKEDTVKRTHRWLNLQAKSIVCNDKVQIPFGSSCDIQITPDMLLENPCDTITDSLYYHLILFGENKNGEREVLATGGGKDGLYPIITKEQLALCGGILNAEIEQRYYENSSLSFCNNGIQKLSCITSIQIEDKSAPIFITSSTADTFKTCLTEYTEQSLGLIPPKAIDNCDSASVSFEKVTIINDGKICDTTRLNVTWKATDACGNINTIKQLVVLLRPGLEDLIKAENIILSCGENPIATTEKLTKN